MDNLSIYIYIYIIIYIYTVMCVCRNVMFTTHQIDGEHTTHKNGDDWGMVYYCYTHITMDFRIKPGEIRICTALGMNMNL